jgi:hypothetical protein
MPALPLRSRNRSHVPVRSYIGQKATYASQQTVGLFDQIVGASEEFPRHAPRAFAILRLTGPEPYRSPPIAAGS